MNLCFPGAYDAWKKLLNILLRISGFLFPGQTPPGLSEADERWEGLNFGPGRSCCKLLLLQWLNLDLKKEGGMVFVNISLVSWVVDPFSSGFC